MIVIRRDLARAFRALARMCLAGRPRGPAPPVVCRACAGILTLWARTETAGLAYSTPTPETGEEVLVVPMAVLGAVEGAAADPVELAAGPGLAGTARWAHRGVPQTHPFDALLPGRQHTVPDPSDDPAPIPALFLAALHECGRTAARDAGGRFALTHLQVRGAAGQVVGTDGRRALVWGGFRLPFPDDLVVPAVPAFGSREFAGAGEVRVGRTAADLVVAAGPWRVHLPVNPAGKFPDVAAVIPKAGAGTAARLDGRDAADLLRALPDLPGADDEDRPVTLDLDGGVTVRARDDETGAVREVRLARSRSAGSPARVALDRAALARALALGCHAVRTDPAGKVLAAEGPDRTFVVAALAPDRAVPPADAVTDTTTTDGTGEELVPQPDTDERRTAVKPNATNGRPPDGRPDPPDGDPPDPLAEAEALRAALAEAAARAARLVTALKARQKEKKALATAWSSLKALNLGPGGQP